MKDGNDYYIGETFRSKDGRARLTYHPDWDSLRPWVGYIDGTAGRHYGYLSLGVSDMQDRGHRIDTTRK
jgi:hypothetical protein